MGLSPMRGDAFASKLFKDSGMNIRFKLGSASACLALLLLASCGGGDSENKTDTAGRRARALAVPQVPSPTLTAAWTQLPNPNYAPPNGPYTRVWTEMTWDSVRQEIVLFGGNGPTSYENDVWAYNGTSTLWTNLDPNVFCPGNTGFSKPNGTDDTAFKYDPENNLYWVFGAASGYRCLSYATTHTAGPGTSTTSIVDTSLTQTTDGTFTNWRVRVGNTDVGVTAYDGSSKTLALDAAVTGLTANSSYLLYATTGAGVWYYSPVSQSWVGQNTPAGNTGPTPTGARIAPAVDYSTADKAFALFGGWSAGSDRSVWRLDVTTKLWTKLPIPATGAPPHMRELLNSFVYDKVNDVFILFGGQCSYDTTCPDNTFNGSTWAYKLSTNTWTNMGPPAAPSARSQHLMAFDSDNGVVVLHGGVSQGGVINNDTWYYHYPSNTWTQVVPSNPPTPRYLAQVAYDPVRKQTVIFGGQGSTGARADIWGLKLTPSNGLPTVSVTSPSAGSSFTVSTNVAIAANAADSNGSITKVEFFIDGAKIGEALNSPYTLNWVPSSTGTYALTAVAKDNDGNSVTSATVSVTVVPNKAPTVSLTSPANGSTATAPANLTLAANAADSDGSVAQVDFYAGMTKIGSATAAPYTVAWNGVDTGTYTLTAVATDNLGATTTSAAVTVTVGANQAPSISLSTPINGSIYTAPAGIVITANAADADGNIAKVEYYSGATKLGETTTAPHAFTWSNVAAGSYSLTAVAIDNLGASTTSAAVGITVNPPTGSGSLINVALPANGGVASASSRYSANHAAGGVNNGVRNCRDLGNGGVWVDQTTNQFPDWVQVTFNGMKNVDRIEVFTMPDNTAAAGEPTPSQTFTLYGITAFNVQYWTGAAWATVPGGTVTGNNQVWRTLTFPTITTDRVRVLVNSTTSYGLSFVCELEAWSTSNNSAPTVSMTAPVNGSNATAPASFVLAANATDNDGSVAKVEFFANGTKLGEDATAPYNLTWNNVGAGSYSITAVATDNQGTSTTSAAVTVTVGANVAPTVSLASPTNGSTYTAPASVVFTANAADSDGSVAKVEYYAGATKLGETTAAPHTFTWSNAPAGSYTLTAVAIDNVGATTTSAAVVVTINTASGGTSVNVALPANGGVASASSRYSSNHPASGVNNGVRNCRDLGNGGVWVDQTTNQFPDWVQIAFNGTKNIDRIEVFTMPNSTASAGEPTQSQTFTLYGITAFDVQYWTGSVWVNVPGGSVTGNNLVWRSFVFPAVATDRVRVLVNSATSYGLSFVCELEAWSTN